MNIIMDSTRKFGILWEKTLNVMVLFMEKFR